jgi:hypothetical protein
LVLVNLDFPNLIITRVSVTLCLRFAHSLMLFLCWIHHGMMPDTWLQIEGRNKSACPPSCVKFCTLTPKIC